MLGVEGEVEDEVKEVRRDVCLFRAASASAFLLLPAFHRTKKEGAGYGPTH